MFKEELHDVNFLLNIFFIILLNYTKNIAYYVLFIKVLQNNFFSIAMTSSKIFYFIHKEFLLFFDIELLELCLRFLQFELTQF
jgi:hypothetical protein